MTDHPFGHSAGMWAFLGTPKVADVDWLVISTHLLVTNGTDKVYALAHGDSGDSPALARNVTVKRAADGNSDTGGTIKVTGTSVHGDVITEDILVGADGVVVAGIKAFATVTLVEGVDWVIDGNNDTVEVGFGGLIGLPTDVAATLRDGGHTPDGLVGGVLTVPTIVTDADEPEKNTVDLSGGTFNGSKEAYLLVVTF